MQHPPPFTRRRALAALAGGLALPGLPAGADGPDQTNSSRQRPPATKKSYTQREFVQLSKRQLDQIWTNSHGGTYTPRIAGFSHYLDGYIFTLAVMNRRRAQRLVRDMGKLKSTKARRARLAREVQSSQSELARLEAALKRAKARKSKAAISETSYRISTEKLYLDAAKRWLDKPSEGTN